MTREEKQLLLKDLCARLPYGVKVVAKMSKNNFSDVYDLRDIENDATLDIKQRVRVWHYGNYSSVNSFPIEDCKPYLRPMSNMTKKERLVYEQRLHDVGRSIDVIDADDVVPHIDWLLSNHFDFRGLIPMGLALVAPEGMYKTE